MSQRLPDKNLLIGHYLQELFILSSEIIRTFNEIEEIVNIPKPGMDGVLMFPNNHGKYFFVHPEVFTRIATIQVHSANIKKIIFPTPRKKNEAKFKYDIRVKRTEEIQDNFDIRKILEIKNSEVRNTLEHYDERLDIASLRLWNGSMSDEYQVIASNVIISSDGALIGNPYYLKCYVIDSKVYKNAKKESNIGKIVSEAKYIQEVTKAYQMTGSVIPLPPRNNS